MEPKSKLEFESKLEKDDDVDLNMI